ncbi:OmpA family protein [Novosphingobium olei]|uniref:OmpA family protein n=1 Tax=Novosphingobium olei TaxID=2728851 RepID=A0A7Y0BLH9_9SPHN|nr:OmpA family protein [Novosphingobium olei]NML92478.1 OmpA family protein [Novosphingobium olei]BEV01666.1 OmpA family protein [Novosphingobium olei]
MRVTLKTAGLIAPAMLLAASASASFAQGMGQPDPAAQPTAAEPAPEALQSSASAQAIAGPELNGNISARKGDQIEVLAADGTRTVVTVSDATKIRAKKGFLQGSAKLNEAALINGLPVSIKTLQAGGALMASEITFKNGDLKTANMIRTGTAQGFAEQSAATEALRARFGDIDKYNVKSTSNVYFDTGKSNLSPQAKAELCTAASQAETNENALLLVIGYTDSVGGDDYNQTLSEKRAARVTNYLQQVCHWKPYRMLTPTGMAKADPAADNSTPEGKAQNRRVAVNVLVSKAVDTGG